MAEVVLFIPKPELDAEENLRDFVAMCRDQLTVFGADLDFDENTWDLSSTIKLKGHGNKRFRVPFSTLLTARAKQVEFMSEPFLSFAKADFRYSFALRPTKSPNRRIAALRALEQVLSERGESPNPARATAETFNQSAQLIKEHFTSGAAYRIGGQLELLAQFMSDNRLVAVPIDWRNPLKRPSSSTRVGKEFDERRSKRLPSEAALEALPKVFHLASEPFDVLVSSTAAILCSSPDRINEVLLLPENCEVRQPHPNGDEAYGLRWWPAKGADPMVKWVVPSMAEVVASAIEKIRQTTFEARKIALWYEKNPTKLYLPDRLEHLRGNEHLNLPEVCEILFGIHSSKGENIWCINNGIPRLKHHGRVFVRFADVEHAILGMLPADFPFINQEIGLTYGNALYVVRQNEFHSQRGTMQCLVESVSINQINAGLGAKSEHGVKSIFDKLGFTEPDGRSIRVSTHQFRHYLNTLAQAGGMSQLDIAKWSGRKDVCQNSAYDHVSADELVLKIRDALGDDRKMFGPLAEIPKQVVIHRDEFARLKVPTAHTTEFGACIHDYTMSPCQLHADCINCNEQVCIKGDDARTARIRAALAIAEESLEAAMQAQEDGYFGANRWVEHHRTTVERLSQLCAILDDPRVPVGAIIQLSNMPTVSRIDQAVEARSPLEHKPASLPAEEPTMSAIRNLLSGMDDVNG